MRKPILIIAAITVVAAAVWVFHDHGCHLPATRSALGARVTFHSISRIDPGTVRLTVSVDDAKLAKQGERLLLDRPIVPVSQRSDCVSNLKGILTYIGRIPAPKPVAFVVGIPLDSRWITIEQPVVRDSPRRHATFLFKDVATNELPVTRSTFGGTVTLRRAYTHFVPDPHQGWQSLDKDQSPPLYQRRCFGLVLDWHLSKPFCTTDTTEMKLTDPAGRELRCAAHFGRKLGSQPATGHDWPDYEWMYTFSGPDTALKRFTFKLSTVLATPKADKAVVRWENVRVPPWSKQ
jgi:hypothetical protein